MRVGIDYRAALVNREGIGRYTRELVRGLVELGFDGNLGLFGYTLAASKFGRSELGLQASRAELLRLRLPARILPRLLRGLNKGVDDLVGGCDVYHHTQPNLLDVREASEVVTIHDCIYTLDAGYMDPESAQRMTRVAQEQVRRARRILVPSRFVGAEVVMALGAHPARVSVTPLGCDHIVRHIPPGGFPRSSEPYILTVSRIDPRKNHLRILSAFERLVAEGLPQRWVIAGPMGWGAEPFERALAASPARHSIELLPAASEAALAKLYAQADAFVFPSLNEGFGLPPVEAMACDTPVITSCVTSMGEICEDAAILVEPTDVDQIFEAMRSVCQDADLAEDLVLRGRQRARILTWRECARATLVAYQAATQPEPEAGPSLMRRL
ncbi:MAG: glycosyltransferase family 1 protein [bacterium]|jgi:glycosyltransferase involved in cell wall biosynthesis|nr:glycosyltransferase family 1 protein [Planctomycetota bacterium]HIL53290.1 glycosyltransferase family 1 protein [Planctomycetota bacterium]